MVNNPINRARIKQMNKDEKNRFQKNKNFAGPGKARSQESPKTQTSDR